VARLVGDGRSPPRAARPTRVIGIDPGSRVTGWGVIELQGRRMALVACGAVTADEREPVPRRLALLADGLRRVLRTYRPEAAAVELAFFGKSASASLRIGEARGAALVELARAGVPVEEFTPSEVKKSVTGRGDAHKRQVQCMAGALLGCARAPEPLDASDALAAAICLAHRLGSPDGRSVGSGPSRRRRPR